MLRKYKNPLTEWIRAVDLDPADFTTTEEDDAQFQRFSLILKGSNLRFTLRGRCEDGVWRFDCSYTRVFIKLPEPTYTEVGFSSFNWMDFAEIKPKFDSWLTTQAKRYRDYLRELEEDSELPNLWAETAPRSLTTGNPDVQQNVPFTSVEQQRIHETLTKFEETIRSWQVLNEDQFRLLQHEIEYLIDSSKRLGRKDWLAAAAGALIGFTFQAGLTAQVATRIIHLAGEAIQWIGQTPLLLP